jgi:single-strand DNA-binding protein
MENFPKGFGWTKQSIVLSLKGFNHMATFNKVILVGNLVRDPELRTTPNGTAICRFTMAVSRQFRNADGSQKEEVLFIEVDSFNKQAEAVARYMSKGRSILVEGRLRLDQWESQNGEKRSRITVVTESFQFLPAKSGGDEEYAGNAPIGDLGGGSGGGGRSSGPNSRRPARENSGRQRRGEEKSENVEDDEDVPF